MLLEVLLGPVWSLELGWLCKILGLTHCYWLFINWHMVIVYGYSILSYL